MVDVSIALPCAVFVILALVAVWSFGMGRWW